MKLFALAAAGVAAADDVEPLQRFVVVGLVVAAVQWREWFFRHPCSAQPKQ